MSSLISIVPLSVGIGKVSDSSERYFVPMFCFLQSLLDKSVLV